MAVRDMLNVGWSIEKITSSTKHKDFKKITITLHWFEQIPTGFSLDVVGLSCGYKLKNHLNM